MHCSTRWNSVCSQNKFLTQRYFFGPKTRVPVLGGKFKKITMARKITTRPITSNSFLDNEHHVDCIILWKSSVVIISWSDLSSKIIILWCVRICDQSFHCLKKWRGKTAITEETFGIFPQTFEIGSYSCSALYSHLSASQSKRHQLSSLMSYLAEFCYLFALLFCLFFFYFTCSSSLLYVIIVLVIIIILLYLL